MSEAIKGCALCKAWIHTILDEHGINDETGEYFCVKCMEDMPEFAGWGLFQDYPDQWHVRPLNEANHLHDPNCPCKPKVELSNGIDIVTHNSFDGREAVEQIKELLKGKL